MSLGILINIIPNGMCGAIRLTVIGPAPGKVGTCGGRLPTGNLTECVEVTAVVVLVSFLISTTENLAL